MPIKFETLPFKYYPRSEQRDYLYARLEEGELLDIGVIEEEIKRNNKHTGIYKVSLLSRQGEIRAVQLFPYISATEVMGVIYPQGTRVLIAYVTKDRIPVILGCLPFSLNGIDQMPYVDDLRESSFVYRSEKTAITFGKEGDVEILSEDSIDLGVGESIESIDNEKIMIQRRESSFEVKNKEVNLSSSGIKFEGNFEQEGDEAILKSKVKLGKGPIYRKPMLGSYAGSLMEIILSVSISPPKAFYDPLTSHIPSAEEPEDVEVS